MRELEIEEVKKLELDILLYFDKFCKENNLRYWIAFGTLIGAIRHKGFIPWDDDVDVLMPRPDYEKFMESFNRDRQQRYSVIVPSDNIAKHTFMKVVDNNTEKREISYDYTETIGLDIDIFPLDGSPDVESEWVELFNRKHKLYEKWNNIVLASTAGSLKGRIYRFFKRIQYKLTGVDKDKILDELLKISLSYDYENSKYVNSWGSFYEKVTEIYEKSSFDETVLVDFEGYKFPAPVGYDSVLRAYYGDYMELPPEKDRVTHHGYKAFYKGEK